MTAISLDLISYLHPWYTWTRKLTLLSVYYTDLHIQFEIGTTKTQQKTGQKLIKIKSGETVKNVCYISMYNERMQIVCTVY